MFLGRGGWVSLLTQQDNDAEENGHQSPRAEASRQEQGLGTAGLHVPPAVTGAHPDGQRARAALDRVVVV